MPAGSFFKTRGTVFVVYCFTQVQDGHEEHVKLFDTAEAALKYINDGANPWGATNSFKLFYLGEEIPLTASKDVAIVVPAKTESRTVYSIKKGKK